MKSFELSFSDDDDEDDDVGDRGNNMKSSDYGHVNSMMFSVHGHNMMNSQARPREVAKKLI